MPHEKANFPRRSQLPMTLSLQPMRWMSSALKNALADCLKFPSQTVQLRSKNVSQRRRAPRSSATQTLQLVQLAEGRNQKNHR